MSKPRGPKPKGARNLLWNATTKSIWYERVVQGQRIRFNLKRSTWSEAITDRDRYERESPRINPTKEVDPAEVPTFAALIPQYLGSRKFGRLAASK